jgi:hypothetical protein
MKPLMLFLSSLIFYSCNLNTQLDEEFKNKISEKKVAIEKPKNFSKEDSLDKKKATN